MPGSKASCEPLFVFLPTNTEGAEQQHLLQVGERVTLILSTEAGKNYYVWQEVKMGLLMARSKLSQVSEGEGKKGVMG
ncbi:hypothetical protein SJS28_04350 [Aeromonas media]|uniref:hypothetical protein n=1 Tax=Aeromonas media TaxID=651 RepID=UPI0029DAC952|nr:hypothetical protein [Aeromonas media]MDX7898391.1 hypothetical protein [Aeromonas media]